MVKEFHEISEFKNSLIFMCLALTVLDVREQNDVIDFVLVFLVLTLNTFHTLF